MDLNDSLGFLLNRAARAVASHLAAELQPLGLTTAQWVVLHHVATHPGEHQESVARALGVDAPTLVGVLGRLETRGLVERVPDPADRRRRLVRVTPAAEPAAGAACARAVNERAAAGLSEPEREQLRALLRRVLTNLEVP